ncbi:MAG: FAD-dependent oxidoreductase, partial [Chitinophagaceae bacterium]
MLVSAMALGHGVFAQQAEQVDVCIYGGTSAGIMAAYTAQKHHKKVLLIVSGKHLGGLTTGGLGYTDIGNKYAITGLARDFYRRVGKEYGKFEQWIFEPSVASKVFQQYIRDAKFPMINEYHITKAEKQNGALTAITVVSENGSGTSKTIKAKVFIDCSYEGDLMAAAGVSYTVGREANSVYNETYNGYQLREHHQFPDGIDPYKTPGQPESGLLWGISAEQPAQQGSGDNKVQAYNFRICLTSNPSNKVEITRPEAYDSTRYELLLRYLAKKPVGDLWGFLKFDLMPNSKTDINNNGPFST